MSKVFLNKLTMAQKKEIRVITKSKYNEHTDSLFARLKLLKLQDIYQYYLGRRKLIFKKFLKIVKNIL